MTSSTQSAGLRVLTLGGGVEPPYPQGATIFTVMAAAAQGSRRSSRNALPTRGPSVGPPERMSADGARPSSDSRPGTRLAHRDGEPVTRGARDLGMFRATLPRRNQDLLVLSF